MMHRIKEFRHRKAFEGQLNMSNTLCQENQSSCSNIQYGWGVQSNILIGGCPKHNQNYNNMGGTTSTTTTTTTSTSECWVKNLAGTQLTEAQLSLLSHGTRFVVTPSHPTSGDYIIEVEQACQILTQVEMDEFRLMLGASKEGPFPNPTSPEKKD